MKKASKKTPKLPARKMSIPLKWRKFAEAYAETMDWRKAREIAGVDVATQAEAFAVPGVAEYVGELLDTRLRATGKSRDWVLDRIVDVYERAIGLGKHSIALGALESLRKELSEGEGNARGGVNVTFGENSVVLNQGQGQSREEVEDAIFVDATEGVSETPEEPKLPRSIEFVAENPVRRGWKNEKREKKQDD